MRSLRSHVALGIGLVLSLGGCGGDMAPGLTATQTRPTESPSRPSSPTAATDAPSPPGSVAPSADGAVWLDAGELREARNDTNVVVVGTGQVLVVGSDWSCGASTNGSDSVEIGDPETGVWEKTASLSSPRDAPTVVALPDGRALLTGGAAGEDIGWSAFSSTYIFDPTTRSWSRSGLLNTARTATAAALLLDGRVLVAGGMFLDRTSPDPPRPLDSSELWDSGSGTWTRTGGLSRTRIGASAVTLADGRVLVVGGVAGQENAPIQEASAEVYDPKSGRWSSAGSLFLARGDFAIVALPDGGAIVAGGRDMTAYAPLATVERFDPASNTWAPAQGLPVAVARATGIGLADGRVLLAGGNTYSLDQIDDNGGTFGAGLTAGAWLFDPEGGRWTATASMPSPRAGSSPVLLPDGSVTFAGGYADEGVGTPPCPHADPHVVRYVPGS